MKVPPRRPPRVNWPGEKSDTPHAGLGISTPSPPGPPGKNSALSGRQNQNYPSRNASSLAILKMGFFLITKSLIVRSARADADVN